MGSGSSVGCVPLKRGAAGTARTVGQDATVRSGSAAWEAHLPRVPGEPPRILFLGPEGAGKTALLEMLQTRLPSKKLKNPPPSLQPRAFDLAASGPCGALTAIDQPGADKLRAWWATALLEADGVVFACDSSDTPQLKLLNVTFAGLVPLLNARRVPLLLLATKQDIQGTLSAGRLAAVLRLVDGDPPLLVPFATRGCTLLKGAEGLEEALAWIVENAKPAKPLRRRKAAPEPQPEPEEEEGESEDGSDESERSRSPSPAPPPKRKAKLAAKRKGAKTREEGGYNVRALA